MEKQSKLNKKIADNFYMMCQNVFDNLKNFQYKSSEKYS